MWWNSVEICRRELLTVTELAYTNSKEISIKWRRNPMGAPVKGEVDYATRVVAHVSYNRVVFCTVKDMTNWKEKYVTTLDPTMQLSYNKLEIILSYSIESCNFLFFLSHLKDRRKPNDLMTTQWRPSYAIGYFLCFHDNGIKKEISWKMRYVVGSLVTVNKKSV